jgi:hypothetical protein
MASGFSNQYRPTHKNNTLHDPGKRFATRDHGFISSNKTSLWIVGIEQSLMARVMAERPTKHFHALAPIP